MQFSIDPVLLIFFVLAAPTIGLIYWRRAKDKPLALQRERRAQQLGWRYDGTSIGDIRYRFFGTTANGQSWTLRYDSNASSTGAAPQIIWEVTSLFASQKEFEISSGRRVDALRSPVMRGVAFGIKRLTGVLGVSPAHGLEFATEARVQPVGSGRFRLRWKAMARSPGDLSALLDDETEALLLRWPRAVEKNFDPYREVEVVRDDKGLRIEFKYDTSDMPLFEHVVKLGSALAIRVAR